MNPSDARTPATPLASPDRRGAPAPATRQEPSRAPGPAPAPRAFAAAQTDPARVAEANLELRQVLMQLSGQLELALVDADLGRPPLPREKLLEMLLAVDRAVDVVASHLDPGRPAGDFPVLEVEDFDLHAALATALDARLRAEPAFLRVHGARAMVRADGLKLLAAMEELVGYFVSRRTPGEQVVVDVSDRGLSVEGFVGLIPSHLTLEDLVDQLGAARDGLGFARAVVERHGGALVVARGWRGAAGFAFTLPSLDRIRRQ